MRIYPAVHYVMGGLWVDYELQSTIPGCFVAGEANFSDHGANRLGASALMQGLADGYFVLPYTVPNYLADLLGQAPVPVDDPVFAAAENEVRDRTSQFMAIQGTQSVDHFHRELGKIMWDYCGMERSRQSLEKALAEIPALREEFNKDLRILGTEDSLNQSLEKAGRVADFFELAMLMCRDALHREESCGGHFRVEHQTEEGEALRDDERFAYAAAWGYAPPGSEPVLHKEPLVLRVRAPGPKELQVAVARMLNLTLNVWRQSQTDGGGKLVTYDVPDISEDMSFLEMLDILNDRLLAQGEEPIAFEHDCREGICGSCGMMINGQAHGSQRGTAACQLHMRKFNDGDVITVEPWRAAAFPVVKDLVVNRSALDRIVEAGGFISVTPGAAQDANMIPVPKPVADAAFDAAACIGCGACVAACPNGAAQLFTSAKVAHLNLLPQGQAERFSRVEAMVDTMEEFFGSCTNHGECEAACPKEISIDYIALMNRDYIKAKFKNRKLASQP